jgi:predicted nucleic acid-binding protein
MTILLQMRLLSDAFQAHFPKKSASMTIISTWKISMERRTRVLIDLNVILDTLQKREPHYRESASVLAYAERGIIEGIVAAHSWTTLFYLYKKSQSSDLAKVRITELMQFLSVAALGPAVVEQALNLPYKDFEDAVQMMAAVRSGAEYLVTRNMQDFKAGPLPAIQPVELLAILG